MALKIGELAYTGRAEALPQASTPTIQRVDKLGSELALSQALGNVGVSFIESAQKVSDERGRYQAQEASVFLELTMQKWMQKNKKEFYKPDEIPADIEVRRTDKVVDDYGEVQETPRAEIPAYEVYPQMFKKQFESTVEAGKSYISRPDISTRWGEIHQVEGEKHITQAVVAAREAQTGAIRKATMETIDTAAKAGNLQAVISLAQQFPGTKEEKDAVARKGAHTWELNTIQNSIATGDLQAMEQHIDRLSDPKQSSYLTGPEREAAVRELQQRSMQNIASRAFQDQLKRDNVRIQLDAKARQGNMSEIDARRAREAGVITTDQLLELVHANSTALAKNTSAKLSFADVSRLQDTRPGHSVVVGNTDNQKAVDDGYSTAAAGMSGEDKFGLAISMARKFDYLPAPFRAELQSADRSTNPDVLFAAATQYREVQRYTPASLRDMKDEDTQNIRRVLAVLELGGSNAELDAKAYATKLAKMSASEREQERNRGESVNKYIENASPGDIVDYFQKRGDINRWYQFSGVSKPSVETIAEMKKNGKVPFEYHTGLPASAQSEFEVMFRTELTLNGGDAAIAKQAALGRFAQAWRPTEVNGFGQIMRDMPRGVSDKVLREYIDLAYGAVHGAGEVFIMSDQRTRLASEAKTATVPYQLYRIDPETKAPMFVAQMNYEPMSFSANLAEMRKNAAVTKKEMSALEEAQFVSSNTSGAQTRAMIEVAKRQKAIMEGATIK